MKWSFKVICTSPQTEEHAHFTHGRHESVFLSRPGGPGPGPALLHTGGVIYLSIKMGGGILDTLLNIYYYCIYIYQRPVITPPLESNKNSNQCVRSLGGKG